ncbi:hypothetical protein GCM10022297_13740 [Lactobacillus hamsteri]|uniref:DUF5590 domain-containing protein n=1 Tax=Lactobacillus hamsteri DSM 5661 = JCM 6256 TaxID=1423754 RepID=A0A0R1YG55_9LACO|nr:hypothetical protein [Lactobacillus hamsteri]KRM38067.1 hypothetical protein FC39_GL001460 [Lactobacillus hamsteri DSM 5661 = JCM 6256]
MIQDDTRQTIKFIVWVVVIAIVAYIASVVIFYRAGTPSRNNERQISQIALKKTPIKNVDTYYHLDRGVNSYALKGTNAKGKNYYFIYLPKSKKAYIYPSNKGVSEKRVRDAYKSSHSNSQISNVNLGWYQGKAVWEVSAKTKSGNYNYVLYDFKDGNEINSVANL